MNHQKIGIVLGPLCFLLIVQLSWFQDLASAGKYVLAGTVWMAIWWVTEAVPIAVTALLPLVLFPITGSLTVKETAASYAHPIIFLFIGGFMIATAIQKWNLHQRIALQVINRVGSKPTSLILGFMLATAFLSMWISNTATTIMMLPIALAMMQSLKQEPQDSPAFSKALLLGIAYAASIGGIATLLGTPTNIIFSAMIESYYGWEISFAQWMLFAFPIALLMLVLVWLYLCKRLFKQHKDAPNIALDPKYIQDELMSLGPMRYEEKIVLCIFSLVAFGWISRSFLIKPYFPMVSDTVIAIAGALILFVLPARQIPAAKPDKTALKSKNGTSYPRILDWQTAVQIPWDIILLFGGGLSLAFAFNQSGLAQWIGQQFVQLQGLPLLVVLFLVVLFVNFLTEITSNVATVSMILPVLAALSSSLDLHPYVLMIGATCAASCAFMLPTATAPNAIVFGSGKLQMSDMIKAGLGLNLLSVGLFSLYIYFLMPYLIGIDG
jgi:sodium-dependent dicarboxylate transporter 2/3/5